MPFLTHGCFSLSLATNYSQATNDAIEQAISMGIHFTIAGKLKDHRTT